MVMRMVMGFRGVWAYIGDGLEPLGFGMLVGLLRQRVSISYQVKGMLRELHSLAQTARTQGVSTSSENLCAMMACSKLNALPPPVAPNMCMHTCSKNSADSSACNAAGGKYSHARPQTRTQTYTRAHAQAHTQAHTHTRRHAYEGI